MTSVARFASGALAAAGTAIVIATPAHRAAIEAALTADGYAIDARARGRAPTWPSTRPTHLRASATEADSMPSRSAARSSRCSTRRRARPGPIHAFGEMVALLWDQGRVGDVLDLESLWNDTGNGTRSSCCAAMRCHRSRPAPTLPRPSGCATSTPGSSALSAAPRSPPVPSIACSWRLRRRSATSGSFVRDYFRRSMRQRGASKTPSSSSLSWRPTPYGTHVRRSAFRHLRRRHRPHRSSATRRSRRRCASSPAVRWSGAAASR